MRVRARACGSHVCRRVQREWVKLECVCGCVWTGVCVRERGDSEGRLRLVSVELLDVGR